MAQAASFGISEFTNPSGEIVLRVTGWLDGTRIRRNFPTRAEALAERQALEIQRLQAVAGVRTTVTRLSDEQLHEAEAAFRRVAGKPRSLSFYLDYALTNYREPESQKPLSEVIADYKRAKAHEHEQGRLSAPQLGRIGWDLKRLDEDFPRRTVAELTLPAIVAFLEVGRLSMKTYNNRRGLLSTFFKHAFHRGWIAENPIPKVPHYRIRRKRGSAVTFTTKQAGDLMEPFERFEGQADRVRISSFSFLVLFLAPGLRTRNDCRNEERCQPGGSFGCARCRGAGARA